MCPNSSFAAARTVRIIVIAAIGCVIAVSGAMGEYAPHCKVRPNLTRHVVGVTDGETIVLADGSKVRLAATLAPHILDVAAKVNDWQPARAAQPKLFLRSFLDGMSG